MNAKKAADIAEQIIYFFFAIVLVNSIGVWLPYLSDALGITKLSTTTQKELPNTLMIYFGGIASVGVYDRIRRIIDSPTHHFKKLEFSLWLIASIGMVLLVFWLLNKVKNSQTDTALNLAIVGTIVSYIIWWIANYRPAEDSPVSALGGVIQP